MVYWGCKDCYKVCYDKPPLDFYLYLKNKLSKTISIVNMVKMGANIIIHPIHKGPFHGKQGPENKFSGLSEEYMILWIGM